MEAKYDVTGAERKALVMKIGELTGTKPVYLKVPSCAYQAGTYHIDREGTVTAAGPDEKAALEWLAEGLLEAGYKAVLEGFEEEGADAGTEEEAPSEGGNEAGGPALTVEMPREGLSDEALANLRKIISSKESLIRKALGAEDLTVGERGDRLVFPWFGEALPEEMMAYTRFIEALCRMAKEAKRVTATDKPVENEKYAFRCFLLRLGFIGFQYKEDRKVLMKRLTGSAAFRTEKKGEAGNVSE